MTTAYTSPNAPFVKTSDTSADAAKRLRSERALRLYQMIVEHVRRALWDGKTRDEIAWDLGLLGDTVRPRVKAAIDNGDLIETDRTRETRSGRDAAVLIARRSETV